MCQSAGNRNRIAGLTPRGDQTAGRGRQWLARPLVTPAAGVRSPDAYFFPINAPGMGRFKLFDLVGYS